LKRINKTIAELADTSTMHIVGSDAPVSEAVKMMRADHAACVMVVDEKRLMGVFTERDFLYRIAAVGLNITSTQIRDVMTANPETLKVSDGIAYAINKMVVGGFRNVPLVDDDGRPVGMLRYRHVAGHLVEVFEEVVDEEEPAGKMAEWIDIGGG
jgi:CBS domain-containing protein